MKIIINSIAIYGFGESGQEFYKQAKDHVSVVISDPLHAKTNNPKNLRSCDAAVICLPTEIAEDGSRNISRIRQILDTIPQDIVMIRSLLDPGTTAQLMVITSKQIVYSPYIGNQTLNKDTFSQIIVGGTKIAREPWVYLLQRIYGPKVNYFQCGSTEAELIASTAHAFTALKTTFVNEMYEMSQAFNADWNIVREGWLATKPSLEEATTIRPDQRGYSGKTLPKEVLTLITAGQREGYQARLLTEVHNSNLVFAIEYLGEFLMHAHNAQKNNESVQFKYVTPKLHPAEGVWFKTPIMTS